MLHAYNSLLQCAEHRIALIVRDLLHYKQSGYVNMDDLEDFIREAVPLIQVAAQIEVLAEIFVNCDPEFDAATYSALAELFVRKEAEDTGEKITSFPDEGFEPLPIDLFDDL